jgi:type 2 lantibiotic biosynthesis protein LanM
VLANALPLAERLRAKLVPQPSAPAEAAGALADWQQLVAGGDPIAFARRLAQTGRSLPEIEPLLGQVRYTRLGPTQMWWGMFDELLAWYAQLPAGSSRHPGAPPLVTAGDEPYPFEELWRPAVQYATRQLHRQVGAASFELLSAEALGSLQQGLLRKLFVLSSEVLLTEFDLFKFRVASKLGLLFDRQAGVYGDANYRAFVAWHLERGLVPLVRAYPVLARLVATVCGQWVAANAEFLGRWVADGLHLARHLPGGPVGLPIRQLAGSLSDSHHAGRTVLILTLNNDRKVVYKPRSLGCEVVWNDVLAWVNQYADLGLRRLAAWDRGTHGWMEYVAHAPGRAPAEAALFYRRAGALLALGYALGSSDFHYENLIADGSQPVLIDLETITHHPRRDRVVAEGELDAHLNQVAGESVIRTGLLPRWIGGEEGRAVDVSALGAVAAQSTRVRMPVWHHINTDHMVRALEFKTAEPGPNCFMLDGQPVPPGPYVGEVLAGFTQVYGLLRERHAELLAHGAPLAGLQQLAVRFIFRPTYRYYMLLHEALHPSCMRNGARRSICLDALAADLVHAPLPDTPAWPLLLLEHKALEREDCPYFSGLASGQVLLTEGVRVAQLLENSCYAQLTQRLHRLSAADLARQLQYVQASFDSLGRAGGQPHEASPAPTASPPPGLATASPVTIADATVDARLLAAAQAIGDELCATMLTAGQSSSWMTLKYLPNLQRQQLTAIGPDLFEGAVGVGVFLAALAHSTGQPRYREAAQAALRGVRADLSGPARVLLTRDMPLHGVTGLAGTLYGLSLVAALTNDDALQAEALAGLELFAATRLLAPAPADVLGGRAGTILCLLALHEQTNSALALALARQSADQLLAERVLLDGYWGWLTFEGRMITGFAHGLAGIAHALHRLAAHTGETTYAQAAAETVQLENTTYSPQHHNWPDLRWATANSEPSFADGWCHGAPGIGLARLDMLATDPPKYLPDVRAAVQVLRTASLERADHLCCGSTGRLAILHEIGQCLSLPALQAEARQRAVQLLDRATRNTTYTLGWATYPHVSLPGLFQGTSGIGYGLLRLLTASPLPDVLRLRAHCICLP